MATNGRFESAGETLADAVPLQPRYREDHALEPPAQPPGSSSQLESSKARPSTRGNFHRDTLSRAGSRTAPADAEAVVAAAAVRPHGSWREHDGHGEEDDEEVLVAPASLRAADGDGSGVRQGRGVANEAAKATDDVDLREMRGNTPRSVSRTSPTQKGKVEVLAERGRESGVHARTVQAEVRTEYDNDFANVIDAVVAAGHVGEPEHQVAAQLSRHAAGASAGPGAAAAELHNRRDSPEHADSRHLDKLDLENSSLLGEDISTISSSATAAAGSDYVRPHPVSVPVAADSSHPPPPPACRPHPVTQSSLSSGGERDMSGATEMADCDGAIDDKIEEASSVASLAETSPAGRGHPGAGSGSVDTGLDDEGKIASANSVDGDASSKRQPSPQQQQQQATLKFVDGGLERASPESVPTGNSDINVLQGDGCGSGCGCDEHGESGTRSGHSGGGIGCDPFSLSQGTTPGPTSAYSQALHIVLALIVLVLVAFAKAGDGVPRKRTAHCSGHSGGRGFASSGRRNSRGSSGGGDSGRPPSRGLKRQRPASGGAFSGHSWSLMRSIRAVWSKIWHAAEEDLATRWRAAGQALAALRQAWAGLWVPPPHPEADVLAEALASPPRFCDRRGRRGKRTAGRHGVSSSINSGGVGLLEEKSGAGEVRRAVGLKLLSLCGYHSLGGGGGGRGSRSPKFLLVLDLDETLVHCSPHLLEPTRRRSRGGVGGGGRGGAVRPDLKVEMRGGAPSDRPACMYAWKRPHLDVFLGVVSRWYEVAVFTSGRQCFAEVSRENSELRGAWE